MKLILVLGSVDTKKYVKSRFILLVMALNDTSLIFKKNANKVNLFPLLNCIVFLLVLLLILMFRGLSHLSNANH